MPFPAGTGDGGVRTDKICQRKAIFVTASDGITIRNLDFTRARVPDKNGAGIRIERNDFTIEHSRFINNENGILTTEAPESMIRISDSELSRNGKCAPCADALYERLGDAIPTDRIGNRWSLGVLRK
jgi:hypothetical protein